MATELTDDELRAARTAVGLIQELTKNPDARAHLERGLKVLKPELTTSEDVAAAIRQPLQVEIEALKKREQEREEAAAKLLKETAEADAMRRLEAGFERLRKQEGLTAEGEEKVRQIMKDRQTYDPEAAFAYFERNNPKPVAAESSWTPSHWNYQKDAVEDTKALFADPESWGDETAGQVLLEMRRSRDDT